MVLDTNRESILFFHFLYFIFFDCISEELVIYTKNIY